MREKPTNSSSVTAPTGQLPVRVICILLLLAVIALYFRVVYFEFVNFDDQMYVTENPVVQHGLSSQGVIYVFTSTAAEFWHPLTWLSHMLDYELYGPRAGGHHLTSVFLHAANTVILFFIFLRMTGSTGRSGVVAALFALHPLHVESVAWVAERKDVLSTFFGLLCVWAYVRYAQLAAGGPTPRESKRTSQPASTTKDPWPHYILALVFYALSLMSKPTLVTMPFLLLLLDFWPLKRFPWDGAKSGSVGAKQNPANAPFRLLAEKGPLLLASIAASVAAYWIQASRHNLGSTEQFPLPLRLANVIMSYGLYLRKTIWPFDLAYYYPYPDFWPGGLVMIAGVVLVAVTVGVVLMIRSRPYLFVGWFWYVGTLVPVIGLVQVGTHSMADRYSYVPLIGIFVMVVWGAGDLFGRWRFSSAMQRGIAVASIVGCAAVTWPQVGYWQNSEKLARQAIRVTANNYVAHANLGATLSDQGKHAEALKEFETSFQIEQSVRYKPDQSGIRYNLGTALAQVGRLDEAYRQLYRALELEPTAPKIYRNLASVLALQGKLDDAIAYYQEALRRQPDYKEARADLADVAAQREQWIAASKRYTVASALVKEQKPVEGAKGIREALALRPDWPEVLNNLAWLLATHTNDAARNGPEAVKLAERACVLTAHTNLSFVSTLAAAYAEAGDFPAAIRTETLLIERAKAPDANYPVETAQARLELFQAGHAYRQK